MFNHVDLDLTPLEREHIDGVRYYKIPDEEELLKLVSITSITSWINREIFRAWRAKVGNQEADKITKAATSRGTDMHTLAECYLHNRDLPPVQPLSEYLFKQAKPDLDKIDNVHAIETSLYSEKLGIAGTVDCIAEYDGELSVIDFKTSKYHKPQYILDKYFLQCTAYAQMWTERFPNEPCNQLVIMLTCEEGGPQIVKARRSDYLHQLRTVIGNFYANKK